MAESSLHALVFTPGRDDAPIARLGGKVVLLERGYRLPRGFGPGVSWVCEVSDRERIKLARPLKSANDWYYVPVDHGPKFGGQAQHYLPTGIERPEPPVNGLGHRTTPTALALVASLDDPNNGSTSWERLCRVLGPPMASQDADGDVLLIWPSALGEIKIWQRSYETSDTAVLHWEPLDEFQEVPFQRFSYRADGTVSESPGPELRQWFQCVELPFKRLRHILAGGYSSYTPHQDNAWIAPPDAPEVVRRWVSECQPGPADINLSALDFLRDALAKAHAEGREPVFSKREASGCTTDDDRHSGIGDAWYVCWVDIEGVPGAECANHPDMAHPMRGLHRGDHPDDLVVQAGMAFLYDGLPHGLWKSWTPEQHAELEARARSYLGPVLTVFPPLDANTIVGRRTRYPMLGTCKDGMVVYRWTDAGLVHARKRLSEGIWNTGGWTDYEGWYGPTRPVPTALADVMIRNYVRRQLNELVALEDPLARHGRHDAERIVELRTSILRWKPRIADMSTFDAETLEIEAARQRAIEAARIEDRRQREAAREARRMAEEAQREEAQREEAQRVVDVQTMSAERYVAKAKAQPAHGFGTLAAAFDRAKDCR